MAWTKKDFYHKKWNWGIFNKEVGFHNFYTQDWIEGVHTPQVFVRFKQLSDFFTSLAFNLCESAPTMSSIATIAETDTTKEGGFHIINR